jgi:hypothetical protein
VKNLRLTICLRGRRLKRAPEPNLYVIRNNFVKTGVLEKCEKIL